MQLGFTVELAEPPFCPLDPLPGEPLLAVAGAGSNWKAVGWLDGCVVESRRGRAGVYGPVLAVFTKHNEYRPRRKQRGGLGAEVQVRWCCMPQAGRQARARERSQRDANLARLYRDMAICEHGRTWSWSVVSSMVPIVPSPSPAVISSGLKSAHKRW